MLSEDLSIPRSTAAVIKRIHPTHILTDYYRLRWGTQYMAMLTNYSTANHLCIARNNSNFRTVDTASHCSSLNTFVYKSNAALWLELVSTPGPVLLVSTKTDSRAAS